MIYWVKRPLERGYEIWTQSIENWTIHLSIKSPVRIGEIHMRIFLHPIITFSAVFINGETICFSNLRDVYVHYENDLKFIDIE